MNIRIDLTDADFGAVMTFQQWIALIEAILALLKKRHLSPPAAVRNLTGAVNRSKNMATVTLKWTDPTLRVPDPVTGVAAPLLPGELVSVDIFDTAAPNPDILIGNVLAGVMTFTTDVLTVGDHAFTVVAKDSTGHVSAHSNAFLATIAATQASPAAVTDLSGAINP